MYRKAVSVLTVLILLTQSLALSGALADSYASGTTAGASTVQIDARYGSCYFVLSSSSGLAMVKQHNWAGVYQQDGQEVHHGFYRIRIFDGNGFYENYRWAPSATTNEDEVYTCQELRITLPRAGTYTMTVAPMSYTEAARYWKVDSIAYWIQEATWIVSIMSGCEIHKDSPAGSVSIRCYDETGSLIQTTSRTISQSQTVQPPAVSGYESISSGEYVSLNTSTGTCNPSVLNFYYRQKSVPSTPGTGAVPYEWDTKFKAGISTKNPDAYRWLYRLYDGDPGTTFTYYLYNSDKNNGYPDFTAYFRSGTVSGIKIRNGSASNYYHFMRINQFHVVVYTNSGSYTESVMTVPDSYQYDYYTFSFRRTYTGVSRIEIYIDDRNVGEGEERNYVHIRDIAFY